MTDPDSPINRLSPGALDLWRTVDSYARADRRASLTDDQLEAELGISHDELDAYRDELVAAGVITLRPGETQPLPPTITLTGDTDPTGGIAIRRDWYRSGWESVLPRQGLPLSMIIATAHAREMDGSLDELLDQIMGGEWSMLPGGLDGPLLWTWPRSPGEEPPDAEQLAFDAGLHHQFETALAAAEVPLPATVRDLANLLADLGVFEHTTTDDVEQWWFPDQLPLPAEVLPFPPEVVTELDARRFREVAEPYAQRIIRHLIDDLAQPAHVWTTVERLARVTGLDPDAVRLGLAVLVADGEFRIVRDDGDVNPETLRDHARFRLLSDWTAFAENRITIGKTP